MSLIGQFLQNGIIEKARIKIILELSVMILFNKCVNETNVIVFFIIRHFWFCLKFALKALHNLMSRGVWRHKKLRGIFPLKMLGGK